MRPFNDLKELLPDYYDNVLETDILMDVEEKLFGQLFSEMERAQRNQYISTADSNTLSLWEAILRIHVNPQDDIELRRFRIISRMFSQKPYTLRYLKEILENLGKDITIDMLYDEYKMIIHSYFEKYGQINELDYLVKTIIPANIVVDVINQLRFNQEKNNIYLTAGLVITEEVMITQDAVWDKELHATANQSIAMVPTFVGMITNDTKVNVASNTKANLTSGFVNTEEIIIK